ncbi:MAG: hypothetical protein QXL96_11495 [Ignisphaera sp.]
MTKKKWKWEEVANIIATQGYAYVWSGTVEAYESLKGARYVEAFIMDDVPHVVRYYTHISEKSGIYSRWEAWKIILSPQPFKVKIREEAYEDRIYRTEREERAERIEGEKIKLYLDLTKPKI